MRVAWFTCDEYVRILSATHYFFKEMWPDCPYPVDLVGETFGIKQFNNFLPMGCGQWCDVAIRYFQGLNDHDLVLLLLDDYILSEPVKTDLIERYRTVMENHLDVPFIRLVPCPGPELPSEYPDLGYFSDTQEYLISIQATIWRTKDMLNFLVPGWNPWQFEIMGSERYRHYSKKRMGVKKYDCLQYRNLVLKGIIVEEQQRWIEEYWRTHQ